MNLYLSDHSIDNLGIVLTHLLTNATLIFFIRLSIIFRNGICHLIQCIAGLKSHILKGSVK